MILAPGGFITLGILMGLFRNYQMKKNAAAAGGAPEAAVDGWKELDACGGCALKNLCGGGNAAVVCAKAQPGREEKEAGK